MGNRPTFVCQQSAQKTFLRMLFYVLLLICLCCILACCLFCSEDGIQLREKNKTCVMPSQHPIRHAADPNFFFFWAVLSVDQTYPMASISPRSKATGFGIAALIYSPAYIHLVGGTKLNFLLCVKNVFVRVNTSS